MGRVAILERVGGVAGPVWCTAIGAGKKRFLGLWGSNIVVLPAHGVVIPCTAGLMPPEAGGMGAPLAMEGNTGTTAGLMPPEADGMAGPQQHRKWYTTSAAGCLPSL